MAAGWEQLPGHEHGWCPDCDAWTVLTVNHELRLYRLEIQHDNTCPLLAQIRAVTS